MSIVRPSQSLLESTTESTLRHSKERNLTNNEENISLQRMKRRNSIFKCMARFIEKIGLSRVVFPIFIYNPPKNSTYRFGCRIKTIEDTPVIQVRLSQLPNNSLQSFLVSSVPSLPERPWQSLSF